MSCRHVVIAQLAATVILACKPTSQQSAAPVSAAPAAQLDGANNLFFNRWRGEAQRLTIAGRDFAVQVNHVPGGGPRSGSGGEPGSWTAQVSGDDVVMGFGCTRALTYSLSGSTLRVTNSVDRECDYAVVFGAAVRRYAVNGNEIELHGGHAYAIDPAGGVAALR